MPVSTLNLTESIHEPLFYWKQKCLAFATNIEPGKPAHLCSLIRLYIAGRPTLSSHLDIPKNEAHQFQVLILIYPKMEGGLFPLNNLAGYG